MSSSYVNYKFHGTRLEIIFEEFLHRNEIKFIRQFKIRNFLHNFDYYLVDLDTLVEVDSYKYHGYNPNWSNEVNCKVRLRDEIVNTIVFKCDYNLVRVTEDQLFNDNGLLEILNNPLPLNLIENPIIDKLLASNYKFYVRNVIGNYMPMELHFIGRDETHWKWRSDFDLDEIIDYCKSGKITIYDIYKKFAISRNCLIKRLTAIGLTWNEFVARYLYRTKNEHESLLYTRIQYANLGISDKFLLNKKLLCEYSRLGGLHDLINLTGYSRNLIIKSFMLTFNCSWKSAVDSLNGRA